MRQDSIKKTLISSVLWNAVEKIIVKGSAFVVGIVLARILSPSDYGLISMLSVFILISNLFIESGFAKALIQNKKCEDIDYSTAFVTNILISLLIYILLYVAAPYISLFYNEPILIPLTRILSLNFILGAFNIVHRAKLMASMDFKSLAIINFWGTFLGGIIGILLAYMDYGVWALVFQNISSTIIMVFLFPLFSKWKISFAFKKKCFDRLFKFGSKLLITGVIATIVNNITTIFIGRYYKSNALGYYTRATQYSELPAWTINDVLNTVTFPVLSGLQDDKEKLVAIYKKSLFFTVLLTFPFMTLFALLAKPIVIIVLTEKWLPCVPLLQVLCLARMFTPLSAINLNILNAVGRSDLYMKIDFSKTPIVLTILFITIPLGINAIVWGNLIATIIAFFINGYLPGKLFGYGAIQEIKDWKYIFLSIVIMTVCVYLTQILFSNIYLQLFIGLIIGIVTYLASCIIFKQYEIKEIANILRNKLNLKR